MTKPRVTILMPVTHYHPAFLTKALKSVFCQLCPHWRLCIIVSKSKHGHFKALLKNELQDSRVTLIKNQGRRIGGALNTGMRCAKTSFVASLFADDMWSPTAISILTKAIRQYPSVDFFHSSRIFIDETDRPISSVYRSKASFLIEEFLEIPPVKHLMCWRRRLGLKVGGVDESHNHGSDDYDFPWTMAEAGAKFRAIKEPLYLYRDHRESYRLTTHVPLSCQKWALRKILRKHGVGPELIKKRIAAAEATYLKQCLFENQRDQYQKTKKGYDAHLGWREPYE